MVTGGELRSVMTEVNDNLRTSELCGSLSSPSLFTCTFTSHTTSNMVRGTRLSGLQRDVLSLYRKCLRAARTKPAENRSNFYAFARHEFERNIHMDKKDFSTIEFLLRKGTRQLEIYEAPNITNIAG